MIIVYLLANFYIFFFEFFNEDKLNAIIINAAINNAS